MVRFFNMKRESFVDIHCHIIPGADDGAKDWDMALEMLRREAEEGIGKIILTPHQKPEHMCITLKGIVSRMNHLQDELARCNIPIQLYPGAELLYCRGMRELLETGRVCTLAGSRYVLVEFMPEEDWGYIREGICDLAGGGFLPVLAHVERYAQVADRPERVQELIELGAYIQMNAGSITGEWGYSVRRSCMRLLKRELVHFIGTDAHRAEGKRKPQMMKCAAVLEKQVGSSYAKELLWENAEQIFLNKEL